jgi:hypothetical protein
VKECQPSKHQALSSSHSNTKKKKKKKTWETLIPGISKVFFFLLFSDIRKKKWQKGRHFQKNHTLVFKLYIVWNKNFWPLCSPSSTKYHSLLLLPLHPYSTSPRVHITWYPVWTSCPYVMEDTSISSHWQWEMPEFTWLITSYLLIHTTVDSAALAAK